MPSSFKNSRNSREETQYRQTIMASSPSISRHDIEKFDGQNDFALWKMKMSALLGNLGLEEALEGEAKMPKTYVECWTDFLTIKDTISHPTLTR